MTQEIDEELMTNVLFARALSMSYATYKNLGTSNLLNLPWGNEVETDKMKMPGFNSKVVDLRIKRYQNMKKEKLSQYCKRLSERKNDIECNDYRDLADVYTREKADRYTIPKYIQNQKAYEMKCLEHTITTKNDPFLRRFGTSQKGRAKSLIKL